MIRYVLSFGIGCVVGAFIGFATFCILSVSGDEDSLVNDVR